MTWASLPGVRDSVSSWWKFFFSQEFVSSLHPASWELFPGEEMAFTWQPLETS